MDNFKSALNDAVSAWSKLSEEWEKIEADYSDEVSEHYPFNQDFSEMLRMLIDWRDSLR